MIDELSDTADLEDSRSSFVAAMVEDRIGILAVWCKVEDCDFFCWPLSPLVLFQYFLNPWLSSKTWNEVCTYEKVRLTTRVYVY